ncbi:hypothetical protein BDV95DRAFT_486726 [Massariosphaeria phaeospora]|uniref:C2H2-type domain-containing protein n=1 Tax=Massariosphaeria phaeospora TaxID=100035 RepID=A0A7C8MGN8_9PLEO|nr:hypothetical protein BDV95DRAFT_486726 [Massariosphaeria phaeospora]
MSLSHSVGLPRDIRHDSSVSLLAVPPVSRPQSAVDLSSADPIARFYNDAPWSTEHMRSSRGTTARPSFSQPNMDYRTYRDGPGSEAESIAPRSDSGYYTHHAHSVISNEPERADQELPSDMTFGVSNIEVGSTPSEPKDSFRLQSDQASQYSGRSTTHSREFKCVHCKDISKCRSDYKKHMLKHDKPFKCDISNCRRNGKGFTTINDLARHKKSVHRIGALRNSYQCASENCRNREKVWPRLDNFKQHIHRMHRDEDEQDLIRRSVYEHSEPASAAETLSVAPMDTTLAGIGTDKQFSGNDIDEPVSGISLTPDQDTNQWSSYDPTSHNFALDVDQTNVSSYSYRSGKTELNSGYSNQGESGWFEANAARGTSHQKDSHRTDSLTNSASTQDSPSRPITQGPLLSNAPQTKADQQRQALQKFSKMIVQDIRNATTHESVDLEKVVLRVLYGATKLGNRPEEISTDQRVVEELERDMLTKSEALKASQAISNLIKQSGKSSFTRPRRPVKGFSANSKACGECGTTLARSCDLKKHMKRHTKPYGCTYPQCHKRFGAKSDWKRHENSQHFQLESFRCQLIPTSHLESQHEVKCLEQLSHEVRRRRIGKNGQGKFWCGFCQKIVPLEKKRNAAWDERFDHIDHHFNKEKRHIEDWLCVEAKKTKGEVLSGMDRLSFDEEDMEFYSVDETDNRPTGQEHTPHTATQAIVMQAATPSPEIRAQHFRKRQAPAEPSRPPPPQKRRRRDIVKYCVSTCSSHVRLARS